EEADAARAQPIVDVRVVDDLASEEDVPAGKARDRLVGVVDRAIDAVTEAELAREMDRQPPFLVAEAGRADLVDEPAVVRGGELARNRLFHVEALAEDQGLRGAHLYCLLRLFRTMSRACGVMSSSALSAATCDRVNASDSSSSLSSGVDSGTIARAMSCVS